MSFKIKIGDTRSALFLPADMAAVAVALLTHGKLMFQDGYSSDSPWVADEHGLQINTSDGSEFAPVNPKIVAAQKDAEQKQAWWLSESANNKRLTTELGELKAAFAALQSSVVCTRADSEGVAVVVEPQG